MSLIIIGLPFSTFVRSVEIMCRYKGLSYQLQDHIDGVSLYDKPETCPQYHPFLKFPVLVDGDFVLPESTCIARYLHNLSGKPLLPQTQAAFAQADAWMNHITIDVDQALVRNILLELAFPKGIDGKVRMKKIKASLPIANHALQQLSQKLGSQPFLMGSEFTACDALLIPMLDYLARADFPENPLVNYPSLLDYIQRLRALAYCEPILVESF